EERGGTPGEGIAAWKPSLLTQKAVYGPAAAHVGAGGAHVRQHFFGGAGLLQRVSQDSKPCGVQVPLWENPLLVGGLGQLHHGAGVPEERGRVEADFAEGQRAEEVAEQGRLGGTPGGVVTGLALTGADAADGEVDGAEGHRGGDEVLRKALQVAVCLG